VTVSIPLIALVAIVAYIAYRYMGLRAWHAIVCALLGFLLAATGAAPQIRASSAGSSSGSRPAERGDAR
jgi:hypothetical protein